MRNVGQAVHHYAFDLSDVGGSDREVPERDWAQGSQPVAVLHEATEGDALHVRHLGEQVWHRRVAGGTLPDGYRAACGRVLAIDASEWRLECHIGVPCPKCFTDFEQARFDHKHSSTYYWFDRHPPKDE